jgi:hypothetical protein
MADLKIIRGHVPGISVNRRKGISFDDEMMLLVFISRDKGDVILANFACHPVIVQTQDHVSADYPGEMCRIVESTLSDIRMCMFLQGAAGNINPVAETTLNFSDVTMTGMALAGKVMQLYSTYRLEGAVPAVIDTLRPEAAEHKTDKQKTTERKAVVKAIAKRFTIPSRQLPDSENIGNTINSLDSLKDKIAKGQNVSIKDLEEITRLSEELYRIDMGAGPFDVLLQVIRIGDALLCALPCEPECQIGLELKKAGLPYISIPVGYANEYWGYVCSKQIWNEGGYEVLCRPWSILGPEGYDIMIEGILELSNQLNMLEL